MSDQTKMECPNCEMVTEFDHVRRTAHGLPQTHMDGSEQFVCRKCRRPLLDGQAAKLGLRYVYDEWKNGRAGK